MRKKIFIILIVLVMLTVTMGAYQIHQITDRPERYFASAERLQAEVSHALAGRTDAPKVTVEARTFGRFALLVDGRPVIFRRPKCAELLAYLIDRRGGSVTRPEAFSMLFEEEDRRHPPEKLMHSAPWAKASSSIGEAARIFPISQRGTSRESTARSIPMAYTAFAPSGECIPI